MKESNNLIYGRHSVEEALLAEQQINKIFVQKGLNNSTIKYLVSLSKQKHIPVAYVPKTKLDKLTINGNHQGVVLSIPVIDYKKLDDVLNLAKSNNEDPLIIILDSIEDPHNLGSILRTADAVRIHGIFIPKRHAVGLTDVVAKTSVGAVEHVPVVRVTNLVNLVKKLKELGFWVWGTDMKGKDYRYLNAKGPTAIVVGNEGKGISRLLKQQMDGMLNIPMIGHVQSLNASVAASLLMYQAYNSRYPLN